MWFFVLRRLFLIALLLPLYKISPPPLATSPLENSSGITGGQFGICPQETLNESKDYLNLSANVLVILLSSPQDCSAMSFDIILFRSFAVW